MVDQEYPHPELLRLASEEAQLAALPPETIMFPSNLPMHHYVSPEELPSIAALRPFPTIGVLVLPVGGRQSSVIICLEGYKWLAAARLLKKPTIQCISRRPQPFKNWASANPDERIHPMVLAESLIHLKDVGLDSDLIKILLNKKNDKTLTRLMKMTRWSPDVKKLILGDPDRYPAKFLFSLASKKRSNKEIEAEIQAVGTNKAGLREDCITMEKVVRFCKERNFSDREKQVVFEVLEHLRIVKIGQPLS